MKTATSRNELVKQEVAAKVNALPNLTGDQRTQVQEIAEAYAISHHGQQPSYEGIAILVRSRKSDKETEISRLS